MPLKNFFFRSRSTTVLAIYRRDTRVSRSDSRLSQ